MKEDGAKREIADRAAEVIDKRILETARASPIIVEGGDLEKKVKKIVSDEVYAALGEMETLAELRRKGGQGIVNLLGMC